MAFSPYTRDGVQINTQAVLEMAVLLNALGWNDRASLNAALAAIGGADAITYTFQPNSIEPSWAVIVQGAIVQVLVYGTSNNPQWLYHVFGALYPVTQFPPNTLAHGGFASAWDSIRNAVVRACGSLAGKTVRFCGHSYGGPVCLLGAFEFAREQSVPVHLMQLESPRVITAGYHGARPSLHLNIFRPGDLVCTLPPETAQIVILGVEVVSASPSWVHYGAMWQLSDAATYIPGGGVDVSAWQLPTAVVRTLTVHPLADLNPQIAAALQPVDTTPAAAALLALTQIISARRGPVLADSIGESVVTIGPFNDQWFGRQVVDQASLPNVEQVTFSNPSLYAAPTAGASGMTLLKCSFIFSSANGSWSENVFDGVPGDDYAAALRKMRILAPLRLNLSYTGKTGPGKAEDIGPLSTGLINPINLDWLRVEDELIKHDGRIQAYNTANTWAPAANYAGPTGNFDPELCAELQMYNGNTFWSFYHLHGLPMDAFGFNSQRNSVPLPTWQAKLDRYIAALQAANMGFKSYAATNPTPQTPSAVTYNVTTENYQFTVPWAVPTKPFVVSLTRFRALNFLNGRHPALPTGANTFLLNKGRQPNVPWDNNGFASPVTYQVALYTDYESNGIRRRKIGRAFFQPRGRAKVVRA
jgi:hypothetical protein